MPSPKALQKALAQSAKQAQRLADAFGFTVPTSNRSPQPARAVTDDQPLILH